MSDAIIVFLVLTPLAFLCLINNKSFLYFILDHFKSPDFEYLLDCIIMIEIILHAGLSPAVLKRAAEFFREIWRVSWMVTVPLP